MLFTGEIDSEFVSKHEFGNEWLPSTSDPYFEFTIAKFSFTSTGMHFELQVGSPWTNLAEIWPNCCQIANLQNRVCEF